MNTTETTRSPRRIRTNSRIGSSFKVGDKVKVHSEYNGDYIGFVTEAHGTIALLTGPSGSETYTSAPGVTVKVHQHDDQRLTIRYQFSVSAHDAIVSRFNGDFLPFND